jgi:hypothetical protein
VIMFASLSYVIQPDDDSVISLEEDE